MIKEERISTAKKKEYKHREEVMQLHEYYSWVASSLLW
jgi:hypothetical protein